MEEERLAQAKKSLKYWQSKLKLEDWDLSVKLTDFHRTDYIQTGDVAVDPAHKKATVLISRTPTDKDIHKVVLHELIHALLWEFDHFCESKLNPTDRDEYLALLEKTVDDLTNRF